MGKVNPVGDLDRSIVRRYIQQKLPQIQHCYERGLIGDTHLAGTVNASFLINPQGGVVNSRAGGIGNGEVEACVAGVIANIQFPRPPGGGVVNVSYPFMFRPAGE